MRVVSNWLTIIMQPCNFNWRTMVTIRNLLREATCSLTPALEDGCVQLTWYNQIMTKEIIVITHLNQESVSTIEMSHHHWKTHITKHYEDFHQLYVFASKLAKFQVHFLALLPRYPLAKQITISKDVTQSILHKIESNWISRIYYSWYKWQRSRPYHCRIHPTHLIMSPTSRIHDPFIQYGWLQILCQKILHIPF